MRDARVACIFKDVPRRFPNAFDAPDDGIPAQAIVKKCLEIDAVDIDGDLFTPTDDVA